MSNANMLFSGRGLKLMLKLILLINICNDMGGIFYTRQTMFAPEKLVQNYIQSFTPASSSSICLAAFYSYFCLLYGALPMC